MAGDQTAAGSSRRAFGLLDSMIFIASIAIAGALNRASWWPRLFNGTPLVVVVFGIYWAALPHLIAVTLASLLAQLRYPRPTLRQLARRPGSAACLAASVVILGQLAWIGAVNLSPERSKIVIEFTGRARYEMIILNRDPLRVFLGGLGDRAGYAVLAVWTLMLVGGSWETDSTWTDRLGRAVGWCWLLSLASFWMLSSLMFWMPFYF